MTSTCSTFIDSDTETVSVTALELSGMFRLFISIFPDRKDISSSTLFQFNARLTAALASTTPNPYLWLTICPAPLLDHEESLASFFLQVWTRMCCMSLYAKFGLASIISAITPDARGVAEEVPPKPSV